MKKFLIFLIRFYQKIPFSSHAMCRYQPTCSEYAIESIDRFGSVRGSILAIKRVLRCNPRGGYGFDPVPKELKKCKKQKDYLLF